MSETPSKRRRRGRHAFFPGGDPYAMSPYKGWGAEIKTNDFVDGWREAEAEYARQRKEEQESHAEPDVH